jgi:hypothetical protein
MVRELELVKVTVVRSAVTIFTGLPRVLDPFQENPATTTTQPFCGVIRFGPGSERT